MKLKESVELEILGTSVVLTRGSINSVSTNQELGHRQDNLYIHQRYLQKVFGQLLYNYA